MDICHRIGLRRKFPLSYHLSATEVTALTFAKQTNTQKHTKKEKNLEMLCGERYAFFLKVVEMSAVIPIFSEEEVVRKVRKM